MSDYQYKINDLVVNKGQFFVVESVTTEYSDLLEQTFVVELQASRIDVSTTTKTIGERKLKPEDCTLAADYIRPYLKVLTKFS